MIDFDSQEGAVVLDNEVDLIMQQVEILLDTRNGEVIGDYGYGTRLDVYLYNPNIGNKTVEDAIYSYITSNVELFGWQLEVDVEFLVGTHNDIMLVQISFSKNTDVYSKVYKVTEGSVEY